VNVLGMFAMVAGAAFIAYGGRALSIEVPIAAVVVGGFLGAIADSVVGATLRTSGGATHASRVRSG
jgi:uncharacterized membrane protein